MTDRTSKKVTRLGFSLKVTWWWSLKHLTWASERTELKSLIFISVTIKHAQNVTQKPMRTILPSWCPQNDPKGSGASRTRCTEPDESLFIQRGYHALIKVSSDWLLLGWRHGSSIQRRAQAASTEILQLPESPAKPSLPSADDPGNKRKKYWFTPLTTSQNLFWIIKKKIFVYSIKLLSSSELNKQKDLPGRGKPVPAPTSDHSWSHSQSRSPFSKNSHYLC